MCSKIIALALLSVACLVHGNEVAKDKRQVGSAIVHKDDHEPSETGFHEGHHHGGKYFQYIHDPAKDHYEHGHRRGSDHHFIERHEKAHPHAGEFKTKVRWGDKHGGYGEHYWDFNHAGHDDHGEESQRSEEYAHYDESKQVPKYAESLRGKREPNAKQDVEFINDEARSLHYSGRLPKHGGNYRTAPGLTGLDRAKREHHAINSNSLVYETDLGLIIDQSTGKRYELKPIN